MLYVDDAYYGAEYFDRCFALFARDPILGRCENERFTIRLTDPAFWIALCLYIKSHGGSVFPLPADTPIDAARRRAQRSASSYLVFGGDDGEAALTSIETIEATTRRSELDVPGLVQMSSGTTGEPKYIARSWLSIDTEIGGYVRHFDADSMTPIVACPVNHSYGLISGVLVAIARGVAPLIIKNLNPKYIVRKAREAKAPLLYSSPTMISAITMLAKEDDPHLSVMTSGTLMPQGWFEGIRRRVRQVHQQYGCSEAGCIALGRDITTANQLGAPLPHVELITGSSAADPKEILVKLPGEKLIATRDLGYLKDGCLYFVSRLDDMINVAGFNVYPTEVEEVVLQMPGVVDAVVFKRSHSFGNDQVCLHFVSDATLPHHRVREWCVERLAAHQVPMSIYQVTSIPRLPNGKVSRKALAEATA